MTDIGTPPLSLTNNSNTHAVRILQELLNDKGASIYVDGRFAIGTQRALSEFQTNNKLEPTGIADEATWAKLSGKKAAAKKAPAKKAPAKKAPAKKKAPAGKAKKK
jgi:peptidoglycan hydrolase-like protein with peptidoglycan-binding domain